MPDVFHFTAIMEPKRAEMFERPLRKITDDEVLVKMEAINKLCIRDSFNGVFLKTRLGQNLRTVGNSMSCLLYTSRCV